MQKNIVFLMKKALSFRQKCVSCHSPGKQPVQSTYKTKGGKHYEDRKNHSKPRDAVPVCLMVEGKEVKRYKNIDLPDINLCAEYLDRPIFELAATLLHEMAHFYNLVHDIQDVSNNGYYHNMKFKATTEAHGLHIEKSTRNTAGR